MVSAPATGGADGERPPAFQCPACGKSFTLPPTVHIPAEGLKGKCIGCQSRLLLRHGGEVSLVPENRPDETKWHYRLGQDDLGPFSREEIAEFVKAGAVKPATLLKPLGGSWAEAATFGSLSALFAPAVAEAERDPSQDSDAGPEGPLGDEDHCYAHPQTHPERYCSGCLRYLCEACSPEKLVAGMLKPMRACAACGSSTVAAPHIVRWAPFHRDMAKVFTAPFRGDAGYMFAFLVLLEILKTPVSFAPLFGLFGLVILASLQWSYLLHAIREVASGSYDLPSWPDVSDFTEIFFRFVKVFFVTVVSLLPFILGVCILGAAASTSLAAAGAGGPSALLAGAGLLAVGLILLAAVFYLIYLPVCIGIVAVFNTVLPALNPLIIFKVVGRIGVPWFFAALFWFALLVFQVGAMACFGKIPFVGVLVNGLVSAYTSLLFSYTLGRVFAENERKIGWS